MDRLDGLGELVADCGLRLVDAGKRRKRDGHISRGCSLMILAG